jgi:hypothetical protein
MLPWRCAVEFGARWLQFVLRNAVGVTLLALWQRR